MLWSQIYSWVETHLGFSAATTHRLIISIIAIILLWAIRRLVLLWIYRRNNDIRFRYRWRKTTLYLITTFGIIIVGRLWFEGIQSLATFLGLMSAGLAIALRDPLVNLAGGLFVVWRQPFKVGDRIQIGEVAGDVIDLRIFQFSLMEIGNWVKADQSTGRVIHVPNARVFTLPQANYSSGFKYIWNEIAVTITFESNWKKAKDLLNRIVNRHGEHLTAEAELKVREASRRFLIYYSKLTPIVYTSVKESGVCLTLRFLCDPRRRRTTEHEIWEDILNEFASHTDIDFAYPTQRFFHNLNEGKPGTQPPDIS